MAQRSYNAAGTAYDISLKSIASVKENSPPIYSPKIQITPKFLCRKVLHIQEEGSLQIEIVHKTLFVYSRIGDLYKPRDNKLCTAETENQKDKGH